MFSFKIYDTDFNLIKLGRGHIGEIITALHIPDFNLLVTASADRTIRFWNTQLTAKQQNEISMNEGGELNSETVTSDVPYMSEVFVYFFNFVFYFLFIDLDCFNAAACFSLV